MVQTVFHSACVQGEWITAGSQTAFAAERAIALHCLCPSQTENIHTFLKMMEDQESELTRQQLQQLQEDVALEDMHDLPTAQETSSRRAGGPPGRLLMFNGSPPLAKATPPQMLLEEVSLLEGNLKLLGKLESHASALKHVLFDEPSTKPGSPRLADSQFLIPQSFTDPLQRTGAKSEVAEDGRRSHSFFNDLEGRVDVMDMDMGDLGSLLDPAC